MVGNTLRARTRTHTLTRIDIYYNIRDVVVSRACALQLFLWGRQRRRPRGRNVTRGILTAVYEVEDFVVFLRLERRAVCGLAAARRSAVIPIMFLFFHAVTTTIAASRTAPS